MNISLFPCKMFPNMLQYFLIFLFKLNVFPMLRHISLLILLSVFFLSASYSQENKKQALSKGPDNGHLVIVDGSLSDPGIYAKFLELAGGSEAKIVIIPLEEGSERFYLLGPGRIQ